MNIRQIIASGVSASSLMVLVLATALAVFPAPSRATDIAWHSKAAPAKWSWVGPERSYERTGTAEFKTGDKATFVANGMNHPLAASTGNLQWEAQYVFRFDDLSAITIHLAGGFDPGKQETKGTGKFVSGTGRFEGIAGEVTLVGHFRGDDTVETDWVGSYSLPAASSGLSRGFQQQ